jgi:hypothetical protein
MRRKQRNAQILKRYANPKFMNITMYMQEHIDEDKMQNLFLINCVPHIKVYVWSGLKKMSKKR